GHRPAIRGKSETGYAGIRLLPFEEHLSRAHLPHLDIALGNHRQKRAVRGKGKGEEVIHKVRELPQLPARGNVPEVDCPVTISKRGGEDFAGRRKNELRYETALLATERPEFSGRGRVPDPDRHVIQAPGSQALAVRGKSDCRMGRLLGGPAEFFPGGHV